MWSGSPTVRHGPPVACVGEPDAFGRLRAEWDGLLRASDADGFFLTWRWAWRWWEAYGSGADIRLFVLRDEEGALVGVAPLHLRRVSVPGVPWGTELAFLGSGDVKSDYLDFIVPRDDAAGRREALVEAVLGSSEWDVLRLEGMREGSPTVDALAAGLRRHGFAFRIETEDVCPYLSLPPDVRDGRPVLGRGLQADIRRKHRALERAGKLDFVVAADPDELEPAIAVFAALNRERLSAKGLAGGFCSPRFAAFQRAAARDLLAADQLRLCFLRVDSRPVAGLWIFAYGGKYLYYQSGFDPAWARFSPGTVVFRFAIEQAIAEGMTEFDFLRGDEAFKRRWTGQARRLVRLTAYRRKPAGLLAWASDAARVALRARGPSGSTGFPPGESRRDGDRASGRRGVTA